MQDEKFRKNYRKTPVLDSPLIKAQDEKFRKNYRKTSVLDSPFNKGAG